MFSHIGLLALVWGLILVGSVSLFGIGPSFADTASVLTKGLFEFKVDNHVYFNTTNKYNRQGNPEPLATNFNIRIDGSVFDLSAFVPFTGPDPNLGSTATSFEWELQRHIFQLSYGVTDRLSLGVRIPWVQVKNNVKFSFDNSGANVGVGGTKSAANPCGFIPTAFGGVAADTAAAQQCLKDLGFKPLRTYQKSGFEDVEVGGRYQFYRSEHFRTAFTGGIRLPTGKVDDEENFADGAFGTGAWGVLLRLNQDFMRIPEGVMKRLGFPSPGAFIVNTTVRYDLILPSTKRLRVTSFAAPLGGVFADVKRDIGDTVQAEISPSLGVLKGVVIGGMYQYTHKFKDHHDCPAAVNGLGTCGDLAIATDFDAHIFVARISFTTLPWVVDGKFPLPIVVALSYRDRFAGNNNLWVSRYVGFNFTMYVQ